MAENLKKKFDFFEYKVEFSGELKFKTRKDKAS